MKPLYLGLTLLLAPAPWVFAQQPAALPPSTATVATDSPATALSEAQLQELLGPVALYPDALIALILPAATEPTQVVLAARHLATKPPAESIDQQPWSESVKGLARYPDVVAWMDANLAWTQQVGAAFEAQPTDVMNAVQNLRTRARALGTLTDTNEQQVIVEDDAIRIEPAQADVIYVPRYDPAVVYVSRPLGLRSSYIRFGRGYPTGVWLSYACDWRQRTVLVIGPAYRATYYNLPHYPVYHYRHDTPGYQHWNPHGVRPRPQFQAPRTPNVVRPAPIPGAPRNPRTDPSPQRYSPTRPPGSPMNRPGGGGWATPQPASPSRLQQPPLLKSSGRSSPPESRILAPAGQPASPSSAPASGGPGETKDGKTQQRGGWR